MVFEIGKGDGFDMVFIRFVGNGEVEGHREELVKASVG